MAFRFNYKSADVRRALREAPDVIEEWVVRAFNQHGFQFKTAMSERFGQQLNEGRNPSTDRMGTRSGALLGSIGFEVDRGGGGVDRVTLRMFIGNSQTIRYAVTQEEGRVIVGKPWLAVPLPPALTPTGRAKIESPSVVRGEPGWFITKTKSGQLLIGRKVGGRAEFWWVLKRSVKIPARLGFVKTVNSQRLRDDRVRRVRAAIGRAIAEVTA